MDKHVNGAAQAMLPAPGASAPLLPPGKLELKYLFGVMFEDGSEYRQTPEDVSLTTPGRPAMYDLLELDKSGEPSLHPHDGKVTPRGGAMLFQLSDDTWRYLVDLRDGHFEIQTVSGRRLIGAPFYLAFPPPGAKLRFFYFRRRRHHMNVSGTIQEDRSVGDVRYTECSQECEYHFGWQTEDRLHQAELILV